MILLLCFDLPRNTKEERKQAARYRKVLVECGFTMKQFSLYEREVKHSVTKNKILEILTEKIPDTGSIVLYSLPNEVSNSQKIILGEKVKIRPVREPKLVVL